jgi:hypothetical protein
MSVFLVITDTYSTWNGVSGFGLADLIDPPPLDRFAAAT